MQHGWVPLSGRGSIWSYTVPKSPLLPAFEALQPYVVAVVALQENPRLRMVGALLNPETDEITGLDAEAVEIGAPVSVVFKRYGEDVALPCWRMHTQ